MITVSVLLPNDGIFFAGETFQCIVTFSNNSKGPASPLMYGSPMTTYSPSSTNTSNFPSRRPSTCTISPKTISTAANIGGGIVGEHQQHRLSESIVGSADYPNHQSINNTAVVLGTSPSNSIATHLNQQTSAVSQQPSSLLKSMYFRSPSAQHLAKQTSTNNNHSQKLKLTGLGGSSSFSSVNSLDRKFNSKSAIHQHQTNFNSNNAASILPSETIVVQKIQKKILENSAFSVYTNSTKSSSFHSATWNKSDNSLYVDTITSPSLQPQVGSISGFKYNLSGTQINNPNYITSNPVGEENMVSDLKGLNISMNHSGSDLDTDEFRSISSRKNSTDKLTAEIMDTFGIESSDELHTPTVSTSMTTAHSLEPSEAKLSTTTNIIYATAQISGALLIDSTLIKTSLFEGLRNKTLSPSVLGFPLISETRTGDGKSSSELKEFPLFLTASNVLFSNLDLASGETKSYRVEMELPKILPPSFKGRSLKTSFSFVLGIQRGSVLQKPKLIQVPIRIFNRSEIDGSKLKFDVFSPIIMKVDSAIINILPPNEKKAFSLKSSDHNLLNGPQSPTASGFVACIDNISWTCQTSQRVNFDISKDNEHIARLYLVRNAYRLGEFIIGAVEFSLGTLPCHYLSVYLEAHESIEPAYAQKSKSNYSKLTNKVYSSAHLGVLNVTKVPLTLFIPSNAPPDFETTVVAVNWFLRIEFITTNSNVVNSPTAKKYSSFLQPIGDSKRLRDIDTFKNDVGETIHFVHLSATPKTTVDVFDCLIPVKVYGNLRAGIKSAAKDYYVE